MIPNELVIEPESRHPLSLPKITLDWILSRPVSEGFRCSSPVAGRQSEVAVSIVVVSFNNLSFTRLCLESVLLNTSGSGFELIVVDNGSADGSREYLLELSRLNAPVRVQLNNSNLGFARACNQGLSLAQNEILVLLNNDTIVPPGWLTGLERGLKAPNAGMVGPVTNRCGNEAEVNVTYQSYGEMLEFAKQRAVEYAGQTSNLRMLVMFCVAFTRRIYEQIGPLDESFELGFFEDEDYSMRLAQAGYSLICMEDVWVHHFGQASFGKLAASGEYGELFHVNRGRFEAKWGVRWRPHARRADNDYRQLVSKVRGVVESVSPFDSIVLVASKGDEDLVSFTGRTGWHLPREKDGTYTGHHPANGRAVIDAVEDGRLKGAEVFVLPSSMFWWLQFYPDLATHLAERFHLLADDETCLVFDLSGRTDDRDYSVCGPNVSEHRGIERLTRKLVTIAYLLDEADSDALEFLGDLAKRLHTPFRLLIIDNAHGEQDFGKFLREVTNQNPQVSLVRTNNRLGLADAAKLGCILSPGDVILCASSENLTISRLQSLCLYASNEEVLATAGDSQAVFIKGKALREAGLVGADGGSSWTDLIHDFRQRLHSRGLNAGIGDSLQPLGKHTPSGDYPRVLAMVHSGKGGARFSVEDVLKGLSEFSHCLLLETGPDAWYLHEVAHNSFRIIQNVRFSEAWSLESGPGEERLKALADICRKFSPDIVNIHHLMGSGPEVIDVFSELGIPVVFSFHDQYVICPTAHLVDDRGRFCGGTCSEGNGQCALNSGYFGNMVTPLKHDFVHTHRKRMSNALKKCQGYVVPSGSTGERLGGFYDFPERGRVEIIPHGRDMPTVQVAARPEPSEVARVVCMGSINLQKGAELVLELARLNQLHGRRFEFHFLGSRPPEFVPEKYGGVYHGSYARGGLQVALNKIAPSFSLLAPICEETFSFTLSESWASGIPVFASDRGALRDRISMHGGGWLFEPEDAGLFLHGMVKVLDCPGEWDRQVDLVRKMPLASVEQECLQLKMHFDQVLAKGDLQ